MIAALLSRADGAGEVLHGVVSLTPMFHFNLAWVRLCNQNY